EGQCGVEGAGSEVRHDRQSEPVPPRVNLTRFPTGTTLTLVFERLRDAFRAALDAAGPGDVRELAARMREAVIEAKVGVRAIRDALGRTETELAAERQQLADAERRGRLAGEI